VRVPGDLDWLRVYSSCHLNSLTLGLMGLDELHLRVLAASSEDPTEKKNAKKGATAILYPCMITMNSYPTFRSS
jgi:hypothetical protein